MTHIIDGFHASHLPGHDPQGAATSLAMHAFIVSMVIVAATWAHQSGTVAKPDAQTTRSFEHLVFTLHESAAPLAGGGGGGNRHRAPIRRAEATGTDRLTMRIEQPASAQ